MSPYPFSTPSVVYLGQAHGEATPAAGSAQAPQPAPAASSRAATH